MRIAAASDKGKMVNRHFGHASTFYIYTKNEDSLILEGIQDVTPLSTGDPDHPFDPERLESIASALNGCTVIYCQKIGAKPKAELLKRGFQVVEFSGNIDDIA